MHVEIALRLVEGDRRQCSLGDVGQEAVGARAVLDAAVAQMMVAVRRAWREAFEIVERLVVFLEVRPARIVGRRLGLIAPVAFAAPGQGLTPAAGVPGPVDALGGQTIADGGVALRRQDGGIVGLGEQGIGRIGLGRRRIGRLHGVDRVEVRRDRALDKMRRALESAGRRGRAQLQAIALGIAIQLGDRFRGRALIGGRIKARAGSDQVLVVQERAAERAHEEVIAQGEVAGDLPQAQIDVVVAIMAHDQGAAVAPGDEAVILAPVDLHLVLVEGVNQVARHDALRQGIAGRRRKDKRCVGEIGDIGLADLIGQVVDDLGTRHHAAPDRR